jgi:L-rhamnose isomerase
MSKVNMMYEIAKEKYAALGVDTDLALKILQKIEISVQCWQGDDLIGFEESNKQLSGGIMATGNYIGRARNADELRRDCLKAFSLSPGKKRFNLHAIYLETNGKQVERDEIIPEHFEGWMQWAKTNNLSLDFNTTMFSHPKAEGYTISSYDKSIRDFWIEHGKRCREIGAEMGRRQGNPCLINHWLIDGCKEAPVDRYERRRMFMESMDQVISKKISKDLLLDCIESKLFGIGLESFTAGSAEMCLGYAISRDLVLTYDMGHFHPTESIADKISSTLLYVDKIMLHTSRGVRWDSDHIVIQNDEVLSLMQEIVRADALDKIFFGLDFFDASINRVAAWIIGIRATQKALLTALLEPKQMLLEKERAGDTTSRLAIVEECKNMPINAVWDYYCEINNVPTGIAWLDDVKDYENRVQSLRI